MDHLRNYLDELQGTLASLDLEAVESCRRQIAEARDRGSRIFLCGNGGSAATASHMANDLGKGASLGHPRGKRFRVTALTDNVSWMTALANDLDYDSIFSEQLRNLGEADDLLIAISGSGNSPNVLDAVAAARELGMRTIGWTGFGGGRLAEAADLAVVVDSHHMGRVEDLHTVLMHVICYYFMEVERPEKRHERTAACHSPVIRAPAADGLSPLAGVGQDHERFPVFHVPRRPGQAADVRRKS